MRKMTFVAALIAALLVLVMICACSQQKKTETAEAPGQGAPPLNLGQNPAPQAGPGMVIVDTDVLACFADEPDYHFSIARDEFLKKDYANASAEIVKGAGFVRLEATRASGDEERMLDDAATSLSELADAVKGATVASVDKLDKTFSHAEQALAYHHEVRAKEYWNEDNAKGAGQDLKAASMHLENSMKYAGEKTEPEAKTALKDAKDLGDKLVAGTAIAAGKVGEAMRDLGVRIEEWGKKTMAPKK